MQKGAAADGADFAVAEKAAQGDVFDVSTEQSRVKVRLAVKPFAPPQTREHQGAGTGCTAVLGGSLIAIEQHF